MEKTISEIIHTNKHANRKKYIDSLTHDKELLKKIKTKYDIRSKYYS